MSSDANDLWEKLKTQRDGTKVQDQAIEVTAEMQKLAKVTMEEYEFYFIPESAKQNKLFVFIINRGVL